MKTALNLAVAAVAMASALTSADAFGCKPTEVQGWMAACDRVTASTKAKCDDRLCHTALHRLVEQETIDCYVSSSLGPASDLSKYLAIDNFCHGEGPDPALAQTPAPPAPTTTAPTPTSQTTPVPTTSAFAGTTPPPPPGPAPTSQVPTISPTTKPAC